MFAVNRIILVLGIICSFNTLAQTTSEKLKKEQQALESSIANSKVLLEKTKSTLKVNQQELMLLNTQISNREKLLRNYDNQIRNADVRIQEKNKQIGELSEQVKVLKEQYAKLLQYAYKNRNKYGKLMYIFASEDYYQALKRAKYIERIQELLKKQFTLIEQHKQLMAKEIAEIEKEKTYKQTLLSEKKEERNALLGDQQKQEGLVSSLKQQEGAILAQLKVEETKRQQLKAQIDAAIKKEIAEAEAKRKKAEAEALAKKKAAEKAAADKAEAERKAKEAAKKPTTTTKTPPAPEEKAPAPSKPEKPIELPETKEAIALSTNFENNKGKLPWPVEKGSITEGFGKNAHPTLSGVYTNNNGVDITTAKNATVRAIFEGEVSSIISIAGAGKVVIVKHGNYRTVYSNLQNVYVNQGDKISTKQSIGSLIAKDGESFSISHFEIHQVSGGSVQSLNPSLWIAR